MNNRDIAKSVGGLNSHDIFEKVISLENLFTAWNEFKRGKEKKLDVQKFALNLEDNIFELHKKLRAGTYQHSNYTSFYICDPKLRYINKATVCDRVVHHAVMRVIESMFDKTFIFDSYSSRKGKGTHRAVGKFRKLAWQLSHNDTKVVWVLKCDIKKFFDSVDHRILLALIKKKIDSTKAMDLIEDIICSFQKTKSKGIPLGNVTSQLFSNIYLNELDQFVKHELKAEYYIRYADDFVILSRDKKYLQDILVHIDKFLSARLKLKLHERKISIRRWSAGTDFLGYVIFPHHTILRTKTKKRIFKKVTRKHKELQCGEIGKENFEQTLQSYFGVLSHCCSTSIRKILEKHHRCF